MVFVAALCLLIGFGLGGLWQSHRGPRSSVNTESEAPGPETEAPRAPASVPPLAATAPVDPAIIAEVKRRIPNYASVPLEKGSQILREAALKDLQATLSQMEPQVKEAEQRVARMEEAKSETEKQAALQKLQRLQAEQAAKLREVTTRSTAQIEALRQLKGSAR